MHKYRLKKKIGEGTFAEVLMAKNLKTGKYTAIKCMKNHFKSVEQVNSLPEIYALKKLCPPSNPHPNIVRLFEVLYDEPTGRLALVFELMDMNMYEAIKGRRSYISENVIKGYMFQLLKAIYHMHKNGIFHRDIKPENVLLKGDNVKLIDFGSCRGIYSKQPYTEYISTRWYRPPECLLTDGYYNYKMDIWGFGCVFFELLSLFPLFPGKHELDQIHKIHNVLGTPSREVFQKFQKFGSQQLMKFPEKHGTGLRSLIPRVSAECIDLLQNLLAYSPEARYTAKQALKHPYFHDLYQQEKQLKLQRKLRQQPSLRSYNGDKERDTSNKRSQQQGQQQQQQMVNQQQQIPGNLQGQINMQQNPQQMNKKPTDSKKNMFTYEKKPRYNYQHSSDSDQEQLPSIKQNDFYSKYKMNYGYKQRNPQKVTNLYEYPNNNQYVSYMTMQKRMNKKQPKHKKNYISPYSQKAMILKRG